MKKWTRKFIEVPYTFMAMNAASVAGLYAFISKTKRKNVWVRSADREAWESTPAPVLAMQEKPFSERFRKAA